MPQSSIKSGAIISYISILLNILISLIYTPWMIKEIGMSDYGIYSLIVSFLSYFLIDFGLGSAISRFIAKYRAEENSDGINRMFSVTTIVYLLMDIVIFLVLGVLYFFLSVIFVKLTQEEFETFRNVYVIAALFSVSTFFFKPYDGAMMAYEFFVRLKTFDLIQRVGTVLLIIVALLWGGDIYALVFINGIVGLIVSLCKFYYFKRHTSVKIQLSLFDKAIAKALLAFSFWIFLINVAQRLRLNIVPSILGVYSGTTEISVFSVGMNLEGFVYTFAFALNGLFIPKVARMVTAGSDRGELTQLMIKVGRIQLYIIGFIIIGLIGLGKSFINLWIGPDFADTYYVAVLLIAPNIISMTQQIGTTLSYVENEVRYNSIIAISISILSFVLSLLLAPYWASIGCAWAVFISLLINLIGLNLFYRYKLKLDIKTFFLQCHIKILPLLLPILTALLFIDNYWGFHSWFSLFMTAGIYTLVYFFIIYAGGMNSTEKEMIFRIIKNIKL